MALTTVSVNLAVDETLQVSSRKSSNWIIPFRPIGKSSMKTSECIDALDVICTFNSKELLLLKLLKERIDASNQVVLKKKGFTLSDSRKITEAMRTMIQRGLVKRIKREHYMVNPYFLVPEKGSQHTLVHEWISLK